MSIKGLYFIISEFYKLFKRTDTILKNLTVYSYK